VFKICEGCIDVRSLARLTPSSAVRVSERCIDNIVLVLFQVVVDLCRDCGVYTEYSVSTLSHMT
jgi:hypothetical protein